LEVKENCIPFDHSYSNQVSAVKHTDCVISIEPGNFVVKQVALFSHPGTANQNNNDVPTGASNSNLKFFGRMESAPGN